MSLLNRHSLFRRNVYQGQSAAYNTPSGTNHPINFARIPVQGELMIAFLTLSGVTIPRTLSSIPSGWNLITSVGDAQNTDELRAYYKIAGASETNLYTWVTAAAQGFSINAYTYFGYNPTAPIGNNATASSNAFNQNFVNSGAITVNAGSLVIAQYSLKGAPVNIPTASNGYLPLTVAIDYGTFYREYTTTLAGEATSITGFGGTGRARSIIVEIKL
jgi:hypothetical protein